VARLADRNDLPLLRSFDLAEGILADAARVATQSVAERRATFSRANLLAEVHRQFHGVRFASPTSGSPRPSAPPPWPPHSRCYSPRPSSTTHPSSCAGPTGRAGSGPRAMRSTPPPPSWRPRLACSTPDARWVARPSRGTVASVTAANLPGRDHPLSLDQATAVEQIATSGRSLDVLVGPAGSGKSTTMAGLRAVWENEHGAGLGARGLAPSAAAAEVLGRRTGHRTPRMWPSGFTSTAKSPSRLNRIAQPPCRAPIESGVSPDAGRCCGSAPRQAAEEEVARWRLAAASSSSSKKPAWPARSPSMNWSPRPVTPAPRCCWSATRPAQRGRRRGRFCRPSARPRRVRPPS
jgi:hypothetical protein